MSSKMSGILTKYSYGIIPFGILSLPWTVDKAGNYSKKYNKETGYIGIKLPSFPHMMYAYVGLTTLCSITYPISFPYIMYDLFIKEKEKEK